MGFLKAILGLIKGFGPPQVSASVDIESGYSMPVLKLHRYEEGDQGTFGRLEVEGFQFHTLELPERGNAQMISRIPAGTYRCTWELSPSKGIELYRLQNVPGRYGVLIHSANFAGDESKGFKAELKGCIALGTRRGKLTGQEAVLSSRKAMDRFHRAMGGEDFELTIT